MKILVHFEQEFYSLDEVSFKAIEKISHVFEAQSKEHLVNQFDNWDVVPRYLRKISDKILSGKKTMIWYLPENGEPL